MSIASDLVEDLLENVAMEIRSKRLDAFVHKYSLGYSFDQMKLKLAFGTLRSDQRLCDANLNNDESIIEP